MHRISTATSVPQPRWLSRGCAGPALDDLCDIARRDLRVGGDRDVADALRTVKSAARAVPVFVNTGVRAENVGAQLDIVDGAIVGTYFKKAGVYENRAERARVEELMSEAKKFREQLV